MKSLILKILLVSFLLFLYGCVSNGETGLLGEVFFEGEPASGVAVEAYLKTGGERNSVPFSVTTTGKDGQYQLNLPEGEYFIVARKQDQSGNNNRMLMAEAPDNPQVVTGGMNRVRLLDLQDMGTRGQLVGSGDTWIEGRLEQQGQPVAEGHIYVYSDGGQDLMGPGYTKVVQADKKGRFKLDLPPGSYYLAARKRADGRKVGRPAVGDLNGLYGDNPVIITAGQKVMIKPLIMKSVQEDQRQSRLNRGTLGMTETSLSGRAVDGAGKPLSGIYLYAYSDSRMTGKPQGISLPTGKSGEFKVYIKKSGTFFVGGRSTFGGPLEPGEWVGTYDGSSDHSIEIENGQDLPLGDIVLREVW